MRKYKQTPWIDKVIEEYKGVGKEQEYYVQTMAIAELIALTKVKQQLQAKQQAHNALREKLKSIEWEYHPSCRDGGESYYCRVCKSSKMNRGYSHMVNGEIVKVDKWVGGHAKDCWLNAELQAIKEESK